MWHRETVKADLVFLHAAIAEHLDLAARHACGRERILIRAARLGREEHGKPLVARRIRVRPYKERHHVGARRMRDPRLVAGDLPRIALAYRARAQAAQVRSRVGLGEDGRRQDLARRNLRQPVLLLRRRATAQDQLGRDLRARAQRAHADIAARQFLRHDAHRRLAKPRTTEFLRDRQPEHAKLAHLPDHRERDELVIEVPSMRMWRHPVGDKLGELRPDEVHVLVEAHITECGRGRVRLDEPGQSCSQYRAAAMRNQVIDGTRGKPRRIRARHAKVGKPHELALAHRNAAHDMRAVFAESSPQDQALRLAKLAL